MLSSLKHLYKTSKQAPAAKALTTFITESMSVCIPDKFIKLLIQAPKGQYNKMMNW